MAFQFIPVILNYQMNIIILKTLEYSSSILLEYYVPSSLAWNFLYCVLEITDTYKYPWQRSILKCTAGQ